MLFCRQVAVALWENFYGELPYFRREGLRVHVKYCIFCGRYHRELIQFQGAARILSERAEREAEEGSLSLSREARERLRRIVSEYG